MKKFSENSKNSISYSRQGWKDLIQRILNNELDISSLNIFQKYEYKIEEYERIYKIHNLPLLCLPNQKIIQSIIIQVGSILQYSIPTIHIMIIPTFIQQERNKFPTKKRVTIIPPKDILNKRSSLIENNSLIITSPKWCSNIDEQSNKYSFLTNQCSSDDLHQLMINEIRRRSSQENQFNRRYYDKYLSRLSLHSISYGFDFDIKKFQNENLSSPPIYHLPANKFELDLNQQEIIRRTSSLKRTI